MNSRWTAQTAFNRANLDKIRERRADNDVRSGTAPVKGKDAGLLSKHGKAAKAVWEELSPAERKKYEEMAEEWNDTGIPLCERWE